MADSQRRRRPSGSFHSVDSNRRVSDQAQYLEQSLFGACTRPWLRWDLVRSREELVAENMMQRQQLIVTSRKVKKHRGFGDHARTLRRDRLGEQLGQRVPLPQLGAVWRRWWEL